VARQVQDIAYEINRIWHRDYGARGTIKANFIADATPYLRAMFYLVSVNDNYQLDSGRDIVQRFLCNVGGWRGEDARRIKHELRELLKK
jgi:hypothetical protein